MKLIGLNGALESGKDATADILCKLHRYNRISIGRYIRDEVINNGFPNEAAWIPDRVRRILRSMHEKRFKEAVYAKPTTIEIRETLQWWGEWRRRQNPQYWNLKMDEEIRNFPVSRLEFGKPIKFVLTDMRMPAEFEYIHSNGGECWQIIRAEALTLKYGQIHQHETESALRNFPFKNYIANNGDLQDLERIVDMTVREYGL